MLGDVTKFLNWACKVDEVPDPEAVLGTDAQDASLQNGSASTQAPEGLATTPDGLVSTGDGTKQAPRQVQQPLERSAADATSTPIPQQQGQGGMISSMAAAVGAGLDAYAPTAVSQGVHNYLPSTAPQQDPDDSSSDSSSDSSDDNSFRSATETRRHSVAFETPHHLEVGGANGRMRTSSEAFSLTSAESGTSVSAAKNDTDGSGEKKKLTSHEKAIQKLAREREKLDRKHQATLAKKRADEEKDITKAQARHEKELAKLAKKEAKEREKTLKKDQAASLSTALQRIKELEAENVIMLEKLRALGGLEAVQDVQDALEGARKRGGSVAKEMGG